MADLFARLGVLATGDGALARPRRRSRFEDAPTASEHGGFVIAADERAATAPRTPHGPEARVDRPVEADAGLVPRPTAPGTDLPSTPPRTEGRVERAVAPTAAERELPGAVAGRAVHGETTAAALPTREPASPAPITTVEEHHVHERHEHVHTTVHREEHHHLSPLTELFQWIEAADPAGTEPPDGAVPAPVPSLSLQEPMDRRVPHGPERAHPTRRVLGAEPVPTVTIGRVEVRTVRPEPPSRPSPVPAPLEFAGPTLEEFLGGRA